MPALSSISLPSLSYVGDHPALTVQLKCATPATVVVSLRSTNSLLPVPAKLTSKAHSARL